MLIKMVLKDEKGLTLVELLLAMMFSLIILAVAYNLFFIGDKLQKGVASEFEIQSDMRYAAEVLNTTIRNSSVAFAVSNDDFDINNLSDGWNYIGLSDNGKEIVEYIWDGSDHIKSILVAEKDDLFYEIFFEQKVEYEHEKMIQFSIKTINSNGHEIMVVNTELEALGAIHIVDREMHMSDNAVVLAYRKDPTPVAAKAHALITMVLDTSGSMRWNMEGYGIVEARRNNPSYNVGDAVSLLPGDGVFDWHWWFTNGNYWSGLWNGPSDWRPCIKVKPYDVNRMTILTDETKKMINNLSQNEIEAHVNIIEFDSKATMGTWRYILNEDDKDALLNVVEGQIANGGTNTGDGLRQAYYAYTNFYNDTSNLFTTEIAEKVITHYIIVLVDGVTTQYSGNPPNFITDPGMVSDSDVNGLGNVLDSEGENYVTVIGNMIKNNGAGPENRPIVPFVIGFSNKWDNDKYIELESVNTIGEALWDASKEGALYSVHQLNINQQGSPAGNDPTRVFWAGDREQLDDIFNIIATRVMVDFWQISGP